MSELCTAFTAENLAMMISVSSFIRLHETILGEEAQDTRQTCLYKQHEQIQYLHSKLKELVQVSSTTFEETVKTAVCDVKAKDCVYRECGHCKKKVISYLSDNNDLQMVWWWQWKTVMDTYKNKTVQKTLKTQVQGNVKKLKEEYSRSIKNMSCHMFNITHQYQTTHSKQHRLGKRERNHSTSTLQRIGVAKN